MNKIGFSAVIVLALILFVSALQSGKLPDNQSIDEHVTREQLVTVINSCFRLITDLAVERSYSDKTNGTVIFTSHEGKFVKKYTDGKYTLVSLPIFQPSDEAALNVYIGNCNARHVLNADLAVNSGRYAEARELYEILFQFERGSDLKKEVFQKRLPLLRKLEAGEEVENNLRKYRELSQYYGEPLRRIDFTQVAVKAEVVSNILAVRLQEFSPH